MKIIVPMAGRGSRLANGNSGIPKTPLPVSGRPMIEWAMLSCEGLEYSKVIFVALAEHEERFGLSKILKSLLPGKVEFLWLDEVTEGQLCTVMAARSEIDSDEGVLIASCDTYVVSDLGADIRRQSPWTRGVISVADLPGDRWSFARVDQSGSVVEVAEKTRISDHASTGLYYFANGREFIHFADQIILNGERTRGEYYVIPVYQKYIDAGHSIGISIARESWDMGTPEAIELAERYTLNQPDRPVRLCAE